MKIESDAKVSDFSDCMELNAIRGSLFYTALNPFVDSALHGSPWAEEYVVCEEDESRLTVQDRYLVKLSILLGQTFKNCKTRQLLKRYLVRLGSAQETSCLEIEVLHRAYLNELVVLYERLGRFAVLVRKAFGREIDVSDLELELLGFFSPVLFQKRNYVQHTLYLGFRGMHELEALESRATCRASFEVYRKQFQICLTELVDWIEYTERSIAEMLPRYLNLVHSKIGRDGRYFAPQRLTADFRIGARLRVDFRKKYDHEQVFKDRNPGLASGLMAEAQSKESET